MGREAQFRKIELDAAPADNEILAFNSSDSTWKNQTAAEAGLTITDYQEFTSTGGNTWTKPTAFTPKALGLPPGRGTWRRFAQTAADTPDK